MNVAELRPQPIRREVVRRDRHGKISDACGAYALCTFDGTVLYVGLTNKLRRRFQEHLDSKEKTGMTPLGRAALFYWLEHQMPASVERGWILQHWNKEGSRPVLNKADSPVSY